MGRRWIYAYVMDALMELNFQSALLAGTAVERGLSGCCACLVYCNAFWTTHTDLVRCCSGFSRSVCRLLQARTRACTLLPSVQQVHVRQLCSSVRERGRGGTERKIGKRERGRSGEREGGRDVEARDRTGHKRHAMFIITYLLPACPPHVALISCPATNCCR